MVGAVALVLAAGAAIATGIAVTSGDTTPATQSIYLNDLEALLNENPAVSNAARADAVHTGRISVSTAPDLSTYEGLVAAGIIPEAFEPATDLSTYEGLVAAGIIPEAFDETTSGTTNPELDHFRSINVVPEPTPAPFAEQPGGPR